MDGLFGHQINIRQFDFSGHRSTFPFPAGTCMPSMIGLQINDHFCPLVMSCLFGIAFGVLIPIGLTVLVWLAIYLYVAWEAHQYHSDDLVRWKNRMIRSIKY